MDTRCSRRDFFKTTVSLGVGLGLGDQLSLAKDTPPARDRFGGLPTAFYGRTRERIPRIILGLGSRFCAIADPEESDRLLHHALDGGLCFWDTAATYENRELGVVSEERIARVLATRRHEVFLSTKVYAREPDDARRQIERSLKRLGVSRLDQLMIHDVRSTEDNADLKGKGRLIEIVHEMRATGVTRFIGFSGHGKAEALKELVDDGDFDSILMALNPWGETREPREEVVLPAAKAKGMAVLVMKAVRPREADPTLKPAELIRYALSLPQPDALVLGTDSMAVLQANIDLLRKFEPLPAADMQRLAGAWQRFHAEGRPPWQQAGYVDGQRA